MNIQKLRTILDEVFDLPFDNIHTNFNDQIINKGIAFFPCGNGLLKEGNSEIPENGILILGKDFGGIDYFQLIKETGEASKITLRNLRPTIEDFEDGIFLSNAFMGLRIEGSGNIDEMPELLNVEYLTRCKKFLQSTIDLIKPQLIITLGTIPNKFLIFNIQLKNEKVLNIPHPSMWHFNLKKAGLNPDEVKKQIRSNISKMNSAT